MNIRQLFAPILLLSAITMVLSITACSNGDEDPVDPPVYLPTSDLTVDLSKEYQEITGFGACNSVFRGASNFPDQSDMQKAYGTGTNDLGLSIFRVSIPADPAQWEAIAAVAAYAQQQGAIVFASPWNAPQGMLDSNSTEKRILPEKYDDYVKHLNDFNAFMSSHGVDLYAISIQNEPDIGDWTRWKPAEVAEFMKNHANGLTNAHVITAESFNFNRTYYDDILNDPVAVNNFEIVGGHIYGNGLGAYPLAEQKGKEIWMTEYLLNESSDNVSVADWSALSQQEKWTQSMRMLRTVHEAMESNWNAYVWWYLKRYYSFIGDGLEGSTAGEVLKRGYAFSQYARFIRPGYRRVDVNIQNDNGLLITAYKHSDESVLVILNPTITGVKAHIALAGKTIASGTSYTTSLTDNRKAASLNVTDNTVTSEIPGSGVTTVVLKL